MINGPKAWCTFAGRADVLALLARTDPDPAQGAQGPLALHRAEGAASTDTTSRCGSRAAARLVGKADATPGYRGMHSFTLNFENYFVPGARTSSAARRASARLLPADGAASPRAGSRPAAARCGLAQAALEKTAEYVVDRVQFGTPIAEFQLTQYTLGRMARDARGGARDHLRRGARDGRGRARGGAARGAGEAARLRHRGRGHAARASCCTAAGATPRSTRSAATSWTRRCCRSSRA